MSGSRLGSGLELTLVSIRSTIASLASSPDGPVTVSGWVETVRDQKKVQFVILRDESGSAQLVHPRTEESDPIADKISDLSLGSFITVSGNLKHDERVKLGGLEVVISELVVVTVALDNPIADDSSIDKRLDWRFLDLRRPEQNLIAKVQTSFEWGMRKYWHENDFIEIHTPKLMASASESRAELFELEYFETKAYLAQSPQFFKQMAQSAGFGKIFEIAPAFRADPSFTSRHATEFISVDAEISWIDSHEDVMKMHEDLLVSGITEVVEKHGSAIEALLGFTLEVPKTPFPRVTLAEAREISKTSGHEIPRVDGDLDPEAERRVSAWALETHGSPFVFVTEYDSTIRPFYHMRKEGDSNITKSYDLLYNGTEIATGAQREHRVDVLEAQAIEKGLHPEELAEYLDFFRYGVPPHGGFGMGLSRVIMLMLQQSSIREVTFLFRGPNRLTP